MIAAKYQSEMEKKIVNNYIDNLSYQSANGVISLK